MGNRSDFARLSRKLAIVLCFAFPLRAFAEGQFGGSLGVTSDYISYGLSQTQGKPAVQADAHYQLRSRNENFAGFLGAFASSLHSDRWNDSDFELDAYLGGTWRVDESTSATLTFTHYAYPGDSARPSYDYEELSLTWGLANQRVFGTITWSPDSPTYRRVVTARCCRKLSYEIATHQPIAHGFTAIVGAGYADLAGLPGYAYWNAGVARSVWDVELNLSYIGTQERAEYLFSEDVAGSRWAASALWRFGGP